MTILILGYGNYGRHHVQAALELGHHVIVVDPALAGLSHKRSYGDETDIQDTVVLKDVPHWNVDLVDIVVPLTDHYDVLMNVQEHLLSTDRDTIKVLCEKPLVQHHEIELMNYYRGNLYIGYGYRFVPGIEVFKGLPYLSIDFYAHKRPHWTLEDLYWNDGVHIFDLFKWLIGRYPEKHEYRLSHTQEGDYPDPVVKGAKCTKQISNGPWGHIFLDFSTVHPVVLLKRQFQAILYERGKNCHTLEESVELTKAVESCLSSLSW